METPSFTYELSTYYVPGPGDATANEEDKVPSPPVERK